MIHNIAKYRQSLLFLCTVIMLAFVFLFGRLFYLCVIKGEYYTIKAQELHERERSIKAARGKILDINGVVLADNKTVCSISVIHNQIDDPEEVIRVLTDKLQLEEAYVKKRVEKYTSIERIKSNVDKNIGDEIRELRLPGVKVDEDYKRYYPYDSLGSKVLGFTGGDNQGIIGLEVVYDEYLSGTAGTIYTITDAKGVEVHGKMETRAEPQEGYNLRTSIDSNIQMYATQLAMQAMDKHEADAVSIIVMNPQNGEIYACVNVPEFNSNDPYTLPANEEGIVYEGEKYTEELNRMWRNDSINDTYEPGSTFKIITAAAGLQEGVVTLEDSFSCPGFITVEDRRIRCHKTTGHGGETFLQGTMNSCNPVFITVGLRLGIDRYYSYFEQFGLKNKTGIDLPGEAGTIMHKKENMGLVELATVSFGQSFQITPIQLLATASALINDGTRVTPHFGLEAVNDQGETVHAFEYETEENLVSKETSETLRYMLEKVVSEGTGKNAYIDGFSIGGKTATSQTLPRGSGKYIASFIGFAPAENPKVITLAVIHNPQGVYYGGQIAAPLVRELYENILPYLERMDYN